MNNTLLLSLGLKRKHYKCRNDIVNIIIILSFAFIYMTKKSNNKIKKKQLLNECSVLELDDGQGMHVSRAWSDSFHSYKTFASKEGSLLLWWDDVCKREGKANKKLFLCSRCPFHFWSVLCCYITHWWWRYVNSVHLVPFPESKRINKTSFATFVT